MPAAGQRGVGGVEGGGGDTNQEGGARPHRRVYGLGRGFRVCAPPHRRRQAARRSPALVLSATEPSVSETSPRSSGGASCCGCCDSTAAISLCLSLHSDFGVWSTSISAPGLSSYSPPPWLPSRPPYTYCKHELLPPPSVPEEVGELCDAQPPQEGRVGLYIGHQAGHRVRHHALLLVLGAAASLGPPHLVRSHMCVRIHT